MKEKQKKHRWTKWQPITQERSCRWRLCRRCGIKEVHHKRRCPRRGALHYFVKLTGERTVFYPTVACVTTTIPGCVGCRAARLTTGVWTDYDREVGGLDRLSDEELRRL